MATRKPSKAQQAARDNFKNKHSVKGREKLASNRAKRAPSKKVGKK